MELEELEVNHGHAGPERRGDAVARGDRRVRRVRVQLAGAARREDHGVGGEPLAASGLAGGGVAGSRGVDEQVDARHPAAVHHEIDEEGVLDDPHRTGTHALDESVLDRAAGRISARVQHARIRVRRLEALHERAVGAAVERHTLFDELADAGGALFDEHAHRVGVRQPGAGDEGVVQMRGGAVVVEHHPGDPALRVPGVGVVEHVFRDEGHVASGCHGVQRRRQARDARPDDDHRGHGRAASMRSSATRAGSATPAGTSMRLTTRPATSSSSTHAR